jgi:hypothetical protein
MVYVTNKDNVNSTDNASGDKHLPPSLIVSQLVFPVNGVFTAAYPLNEFAVTFECLLSTVLKCTALLLIAKSNKTASLSSRCIAYMVYLVSRWAHERNIQTQQ